MATKHAGNVNSGKDLKTAIGRGERSSKRSPSPARIAKPPSPPTLPGRLSKSPNSELVKERKPLSVVSRAASSENRKNVKPASTNAASKRTDSFGQSNEASSTGLKVGGSEDISLERGGHGRSDHMRKSKETPPNGLKVAGSEENSDIRRKPTEISPQSTSSGEKGGSGKASPGLCSECKAAAEGAFCFIGNDGRVSACTTRTAVRLCKNIKCPANNPDYVASLIAAPKKYLVSKRHLLKAQFAPKTKNRQSKSPVADLNTQAIPKANEDNTFSGETDPTNALTPPADQNEASKETAIEDEASNEIAIEDEASNSKVEQNGISSPHTSQDGTPGNQLLFDGEDSPEYSIHEELGEDDQSSDSDSDFIIDGGNSTESWGIESFGSAISTSSDKSRSNGSQRMRRRSINIIEKQDPETVILRKQLIKERRQAGEWMLNYAMEEAVQKLAPHGETKVKVLVEAFEKILSHPDAESGESSPDGPKITPNQAPPTKSVIHS